MLDDERNMPINHERRKGKDRRQEDLNSPLQKERRRRVELRKPAVDDVAISEDEWIMYFCKPTAKVVADLTDDAEAVFERNTR